MTVYTIWYRHITGYWETNYPHVIGFNNKMFWNVINGDWER